jgi:hypothetical protein
LNTFSQSVLPIVYHVLEHLQRDFVLDLPDRRNHLIFHGEGLSFHVPFQLTEQEEVTRCEIE